jgi:tetratricopeptide (TPR) repeat protein
MATNLNMQDPRVIAWAHNNLGILYGKAGMYDRSIAAFNIAVAIEPNNPVALNNRGFTYAFSHQYQRAIEDFSKAIILDHNYAGAYFNRGDAYLKTGNKDLAISDFQRGCDLGDDVACSALQASQIMITPEKKN